MPDAHGVMNHQEILYHYLGGNDEDKVAAAQAAVEQGVTLGGGSSGRLAFVEVTEATPVEFGILGGEALVTPPFTWQDGMVVRVDTGNFQFTQVAESGTRYAVTAKVNGVAAAGNNPVAIKLEATWNAGFSTSRSGALGGVMPRSGLVAGDQIEFVLQGYSVGVTDAVSMSPASGDAWMVVSAL